ncbi:MAG: imidazole glycerol phosphate synthase subunit HisH [Elusimicrobia bacterium]|nr:imidazole glycerol phosphate synthase subunit HisH [Elusimicrobiota bacterium]MBP9127977.1 imidazole glycerol phosphate synthase subunit HisH [Elusimicrobiota bacterium]MBP9699383.1 imidazole glycerol phosphate synthase subunit HisH [Elusimicrobiota bacterium]
MDYGMGNLRSVEKAFERAGARAFVSDRPKALESSDLLVVPGVGAFDAAMEVLRKKGLDRFILDWVRADRPYFGICLGLQLLFESSAEAPGVRGLGVLAGKVVKFPFRRQGLKVPHMGWNEVRPVSPGPAGWNGLLTPSDQYYFVHSYFPRPKDSEVVWTVTPYGGPFCSAVARGRLAATQFHPEKSGPTGLRFLTRLLARVSNPSR